MKLRESIEKTKTSFHKTLQNLKLLFIGGYQKLPKSVTLNPFSCASNLGVEDCEIDRYYADIRNEWECDLEKARQRKNNDAMVSEEAARVEDPPTLKIPFKKQQERRVEEKRRRTPHVRKGEERCSTDDGSYALARKMKELEMMDVGDVEHVLDVEEALHYYSRLKSPVYLDIVDKFFTDMYTEFSVPQANVRRNSITNSKRRLGSIRL